MELLLLLGLAWLVSPVALGIALVVSRKRLRRAESAAAAHAVAGAAARPATGAASEQDSPGVTAGGSAASAGVGVIVPRDVTSLLLLQIDLEQERDSGSLDADRYDGLRRALDEVWAHELARDGYHRDTGKWRSRRDEAWGVLVRQLDEPPGPPPWRATAEPAPAHQPPAPVQSTPAQQRPEPQRTPAPRRSTPAQQRPEPQRTPAPRRSTPAQQPPEPQWTPAPVASPAISPGRAERMALPTPPATVRAEPDSPSPAPPAGGPDGSELDDAWQRTSSVRGAAMPRRDVPVGAPADEPTSAFAFAPAVPSAFGKAIETLSGWPRLVAPFLVQNVGWFVGGFCFIAGTLFLVSVTTGFANALVILASLGVYTGFLIWAGYAMRRKSAELRTSSDVLLTISMLLGPLNLTAGVHLLTAGIGSTTALALGLVLVVAQCAGVLIGARFVNALIDKALPTRHAQLFAALGALQLAAPVVGSIGAWPALAAAHTATLALVGWGLFAFARDWVRSIFLDRRLIAYYAAGVLVFAALVSFVQLTRAYPAPLPAGYFGPYLMALCAMLFYVDAGLKEWTKKHAFLSRFTFALYGLSVVALLLCFDAPGPRIISLVLAVGIYAQVLWRYSSVPALYLLLAAAGWLYGSLALEPLPRALHLLASLPGLAGLYALLRWTEARSVALATVCLRALGLAFIGLAAWSLFHGEPGPIAFATGVAATAGITFALHSAPWLLGTAIGESPRDVVVDPAPWYYVVALLAAVTVAYAPTMPWLGGPDQLAFALLGLAAIAAWIALGRREGATARRTEASVNSALVFTAASVLLGAVAGASRFPVTPSLAALLALAGCLVAWLSVELRASWLFYGTLAALGVTALIVKRTYFPAHSFGVGEQIGVLALWTSVWWLDGRARQIRALSEPLTGERVHGAGGEHRVSYEPGAGDQAGRATSTMRVLWSIPVARARVLPGVPVEEGAQR